MKLSDKARALWADVRGSAPVVETANYSPELPEEDCPETVVPASDAPPARPAGSIAGRTLVIVYSDSRGAVSERQIICHELGAKAGVLYLKGWCLLRQQLRSFRADRVRLVIDPVTGEIHDPGTSFILAFAPDTTTSSRFHYGLSPKEYGAFNAALNVLAFMARCDGEWHALEAEAIEAFATSYWMRAEIAAPLDLDEVNRHAARLAPDAEVFFTSLIACAAHPVLAPVIRRHVAAVIDADGLHHPLEAYWGRQVDEMLAEGVLG